MPSSSLSNRAPGPSSSVVLDENEKGPHPTYPSSLPEAAPSTPLRRSKKPRTKSFEAKEIKKLSTSEGHSNAGNDDHDTRQVDQELLAMFPDLDKDVSRSTARSHAPRSRAKPVSRGHSSSHIPSNPLAARHASTLPKQERKRPRLTLDDRHINVIDID